ncbi:helix-turn-helix domain-containing protein [Aureispira anguillae]|uniref:XRE family transcriptional regulator n=1 Tax=Aureispira anguillae TaxID=2864201 RepID=A0A916DX33_9BACT|nr:XRE family transcriptional regulator [Aureispira anguillae]BDS14651.1 XRE family transcriptional regulator [Aureispira anguillae]
MKETFGKRLKSARLLSLMSQDNLVSAIDGIVSKNAISKYERGEMMPNSKVLIKLAFALSVKPDYFFRPFTVEIESVEFRKKSRLGKKKINAIKQKVTNHVEKYLEIEKLLDIPFRFDNPIAKFQINSGEDIEKAVYTLLDEWKLGFNALPNIIDLLEEKELKVIELDENDSFDGLSGWADGKYPIIVINKNYPIERKRFTALHELGHLLMSFNPNLNHKDIEKFCHRFAGAILIPEETFISELGKRRTRISVPELISIKESYGISIQATMARAFHLDIINEHVYIKFRKYISRNLTEKGLGQYQGKEHSNRFKKLVYRAAAEGVVSVSKAANLSNMKLALFRDELKYL